MAPLATALNLRLT